MRERKPSASQESRRLRVEARRERERQREARLRAAAARDVARQAALARRPDSAGAIVERLVAREADAARGQKLRELLRPIVERAPRLIGGDVPSALKLMAEADWVRPPSAWRPAGKSQDRLFRSLAEHVLARYPMPAFLWSAFFAEEDAPVLARLAVHLGAGGSLYQAVRSGLMPVPLTRGMCHELMSRGGEARFLDAVRRVQVKAAGGDARLLRAWIATRAGRRLHALADEEFWQTVIAWLGANPMLPHAEVGPLVDFIEHRRAETPDFAIQGRSVLATLRAMREWHGQLAKENKWRGSVFGASGLQPMKIDHSRRTFGGKRVVEIWHFREVLDATTLADEGRAMGHCVYSYAPRIACGECSIWTLTLEDDTGHWRRLTIEVRPSQRQIVQARGRFNKLPEPKDTLALQAWASRNNLQLALDRW
jgi:hypothetical protein